MDDGSCHDDRINRSYHADHIKPKIIVAATHYMTPRIEWSPAAYCNAWQDTGKSCPRASCSCASWAARCCCSAARTSPTQSHPPPRESRIAKKSDDPQEHVKKCRNLTSLESHDLMARKVPGNRSGLGSLGSRRTFELDFLQLFPPRQPGTKYWNLLWKQKKYICQCYIYSWLLRSKAGGCNKIRSTWNSKRSTFCQLEPSSAKTFQDFDT